LFVFINYTEATEGFPQIIAPAHLPATVVLSAGPQPPGLPYISMQLSSPLVARAYYV